MNQKKLDEVREQYAQVDWTDDVSVQNMADEVPALLDELEELKATCTCAQTYLTYEGPEVDCAVHGAVRAMHELQKERAAVLELLDSTPDVELDMLPVMIRAIYGKGK